MDSVEIVIRNYDKTCDDPFIFSTWIKNAYYAIKPNPKPKRSWIDLKIKEINNALGKAAVFVACIRGDPQTIIGYLVSEHFLYVKLDYRNQGIEALLRAKEKTNGQRRDPNQA